MWLIFFVFVGLISVEYFVGSCCFWPSVALMPILLCSFLFWCYLERVHSDDVISKSRLLCSMGWFEKTLIVVSVVVGLQNMSISRYVCFRVRDLSRKFIHKLFSMWG